MAALDNAVGKLGRPEPALAVQASICAILAILGLAGVASTALTIYSASTLISLTLLWALISWWYVAGTIFDPYGMFFLALCLFNGGQALLETFGLNADGVLAGRFDDVVVLAALYMVLIGLNFAHLGALIGIACQPRGAQTRTSDTPERSRAEAQSLRVVGWALLALSFGPSAYLLFDATQAVMAGGYMALYQRGAPTGVAAGPQVIATFMIPAAVLLLAGARGRRREKIIAAIVISVHTVIQLFLGYRSTGIMPACAFAWLWHRTETKLKARTMVAAALVLATIVIPITRVTRDFVGSERFALRALSESYASIDNPVLTTISEMGGSMATVAHTYVLVPTTRAFDDGVGYAYAAATLLPNLFWDVHPTIARGTASDWLIRTVDPYAAMHGTGLGYSCIAEAYLNFGWLGVPVVMTFVGIAIARLTSVAAYGDRRRLAFVAAFTAFVLRFPRDESASLVRAFFWYSWLPYVATGLLASLGERKRTVLSAVRRFSADTATFSSDLGLRTKHERPRG